MRVATLTAVAEDVGSAPAASEVAAPIPTVSTMEAAIVHHDERSERSLVHSERITRSWVTGPATVAGATAGDSARVIAVPPPCCIPRCRWSLA